MAILLIGSISIVTLLSPFALFYVWALRFWAPDGTTGRRAVCGWSSLVMVSMAVAVYWLSAFWSPPVATPEWDLYFRFWSRVSSIASLLGFTTGVLGGGPERRVVLTTSLIVPLSWALTKILE